MSETLNLETLQLAQGGHNSREQGVCFAEAVAWFNNEPRAALKPTVDQLQTSAIDLFSRMIDPAVSS